MITREQKNQNKQTTEIVWKKYATKTGTSKK